MLAVPHLQQGAGPEKYPIPQTLLPKRAPYYPTAVREEALNDIYFKYFA